MSQASINPKRFTVGFKYLSHGSINIPHWERFVLQRMYPDLTGNDAPQSI